MWKQSKRKNVKLQKCENGQNAKMFKTKKKCENGQTQKCENGQNATM